MNKKANGSQQPAATATEPVVEPKAGFDKAFDLAVATAKKLDQDAGIPTDDTLDTSDLDAGITSTPQVSGEHQAVPADDLAALPHALRNFKLDLERKTQAERERIQKREAELEFLTKHEDFVRQVASNPALREHIEQWEGWGGHPAAKPTSQAQPEVAEDADPLAEFNEEDRAALNGAFGRFEKQLMGRLEQMLAPVLNQHQQIQKTLAQQAASVEIQSLATTWPDWQEHVTPQELKDFRRENPKLNLIAAYQALAFPRIAAKVAVAGDTRRRVSEVLKRPAPAESGGRRGDPTEDGFDSFDEAFDAAFATMNGRAKTPARR